MAVERGDYRAHLRRTDWEAGRQLLGQCHGSATPPSAILPHSANVLLSRFLSVLYQVPPLFMAYSVSSNKLICMLARLVSLYQGLNPKYCMCVLLYLHSPLTYYFSLSVTVRDNGLLKYSIKHYDTNLETLWQGIHYRLHTKDLQYSLFVSFDLSPVHVVAMLALLWYFFLCLWESEGFIQGQK